MGRVAREIEASAVALWHPECNKTFTGQGGIYGKGNPMKLPENRLKMKNRVFTKEHRQRISKGRMGKVGAGRDPVWKYYDEVVKMYKQGISQRKIAKHFNCRRGPIKGILSHAGLASKKL